MIAAHGPRADVNLSRVGFRLIDDKPISREMAHTALISRAYRTPNHEYGWRSRSSPFRHIQVQGRRSWGRPLSGVGTHLAAGPLGP